MSVQVEFSQVIDRAVEKVFHFMVHEHIHNHPRWDSDIELELESNDPIGVGTIFRRRNTRSGTPVEGTMEVVDFEPNRRFEVIIQDGPVEARGWITFEALGDNQTNVTRGVELPGMDVSMDKSFLMSRFEQTGYEIKRLIESEVAK